jgi:hypothetical protein
MTIMALFINRTYPTIGCVMAIKIMAPAHEPETDKFAVALSAAFGGGASLASGRGSVDMDISL